MWTSFCIIYDNSCSLFEMYSIFDLLGFWHYLIRIQFGLKNHYLYAPNACVSVCTWVCVCVKKVNCTHVKTFLHLVQSCTLCTFSVSFSGLCQFVYLRPEEGFFFKTKSSLTNETMSVSVLSWHETYLAIT